MLETAAEDQTKKLGELIRGIKFAMLTTVAQDGSLHSRPMTAQDVEFDGDLWFFTRADTSPFSESVENLKVGVTFADPASNKYVAMSGTSSVVRDREALERYWKPVYKIFFPQGLDDPDLVLLKINVDKAEYWDAPDSKVARAFSFAKAYLTKDAKQLGEHAKVSL